ncbi:phage late control D family protein [Streptomyces sp. NPDC050504]|uniref:phage late control D family protein n=1 Tax=Streptomyces sp. NPDC050504 TaxID=3365618 RepID=UPI0037A91958
MDHDELRIEIDGTEAADLYPDLLALEVELDNELAGMFRISLALLLRPDGAWSHLDDPRLAVWRKVDITAGLRGETRRLITGYITHQRPRFGPGLAQCRLDVWGMDATVLMDRVERLRTWPNKKDSDIATEVFQQYGLTPRVTSTGIVHKEDVSTVVQRETDIQLLRRLARRNGYECYVDGGTGHFEPAAYGTVPQPVLAVHFGPATNVNRLSVEVDATVPTGVRMAQIDRITGDVLGVDVREGDRLRLGGTTADGLLPPGAEPALVTVTDTAATGGQEMAALCGSVFDEAASLVTGEGEVAANAYGSVLMPRGTVTVKGIGETHSGVYYVTHVTHRFAPDGYVQLFRIERNAIKPTGTEDFG